MEFPSGEEGKARTAAFELPREITELVAQGMELGAADDKVSGIKLDVII